MNTYKIYRDNNWVDVPKFSLEEHIHSSGLSISEYSEVFHKLENLSKINIVCVVHLLPNVFDNVPVSYTMYFLFDTDEEMMLFTLKYL